MFVYTIQDVFGLACLVLLIVGFIVLYTAEKILFWGERKGFWSDKWRRK